MAEAPLKIYKSSAGSGKTFTLVKEYLRLCLDDPERFRRVVAITFTNAAAAEMKERILQRLQSLASGKDHVYEDLLRRDGVAENSIRNAPLLLENILYNYSYFNIGTIDSFFHKILRAFSKELGLPMGFDIFIDTDDALTYAVDNLLHRGDTEAEVHKVLASFVREKVNSGKSWQVRSDLLDMAGELLKENAVARTQASLEEILAFNKEIGALIRDFEAKMHSIGEEAINHLREAHLQVDDFSSKQSGPAGYLLKIQKHKRDYVPGKLLLAALDDPSKWLTAAAKKSPQGSLLEEVVTDHLLPAAMCAKELFDSQYSLYITAKEVSRSIYTFAVYEELGNVLDAYRESQETVLISDLTKILARYILKEDIGFIYSKLGGRYDHFLIDEFQDTSSLQWMGLRPLIESAVTQGASCLVVGDPKQAVYRWRGGEVDLIEHGINRDFAAFATEIALTQNFRSRENIIAFNNSFFQKAAALFSQDQPVMQTLRKIFSEAVQQSGTNREGGFVSVSFLEKEANRKDTFTEKANALLLKQVQQCLADGHRLGDMAVLVRSAADAASVARLFIENEIAFVTQDSLRLDHSPSIKLLFSLLRYLDDPRNTLARTEALFLYRNYFVEEKDRIPLEKILAALAEEDGDSDSGFPPLFETDIPRLACLPVYEIVEECIRHFGLNRPPDVYLQRFQDLVLEFGLTQDLGIRAFLDWWKAGKYSVVLPEGQDAVRVLTIHKSKGLEYPVVFIPYANWDFRSGRGDLLWVEPDDAPFDRFSSLPVYNSESLGQSLFSEAYEEEKALTAIDNLNLLYVAFTRAKDRLYVTSQVQKEVKEEYKNIASLIAAVLLERDDYGQEFHWHRG